MTVLLEHASLVVVFAGRIPLPSDDDVTRALGGTVARGQAVPEGFGAVWVDQADQSLVLIRQQQENVANWRLEVRAAGLESLSFERPARMLRALLPGGREPAARSLGINLQAVYVGPRGGMLDELIRKPAVADLLGTESVSLLRLRADAPFSSGGVHQLMLERTDPASAPRTSAIRIQSNYSFQTSSRSAIREAIREQNLTELADNLSAVLERIEEAGSVSDG